MGKTHIDVFFSACVVMLILLSSLSSGVARLTARQDESILTNVSTSEVMVSCVADGIPIKKQISAESCLSMQQLFSAVMEANAVDPCGEKTRILKTHFIELLSDLGLLSEKVTTEGICSLIEPPWSHTAVSRRWNHLMPPRSSDENNATLFFCSMAGAGWGFVIPPFMLPRPRLFMQWRGFYPDSSAVSVAEMATGRGVIARGTQVGNAYGFIGVGFAFAFPGAPAQFGFLGYSLMTTLQGADMTWYYANFPPLVMEVSPEDGAVDVPVSLSELRFTLKDYDWDKMTYSVVTSPDIGSGSDANVGNGEYSIPVNNLDSGTTYTWTVTVSDGTDTIEEVFSFTTEAVAPVISNPIPANGEKDVPMDITQLQFTLKDPQGDIMEYTVETSPNIGSKHETGVLDGTYTVPINGVTYGVLYLWYVNVTDGAHWTRKTYSFTTGYPSLFNPFDYGWQYRKQISIDHTYVTADLINFTVLLSTTDPDLIKAQTDGDDILFMNSNGTAAKLRHELEIFDQSTGILTVWVNIPSLASTQDTMFSLYYGNPNCSNQQYPEKTWDARYLAVWHLNNNPTGIILDSTIKDNDGITKGDMTSSDLVNGKIGRCLNFDGIDDLISFEEFTESLNTGTCVAWIQTTSSELGAVWAEADMNNDKPYIICGKYTNDFLTFCRDVSGGSSNYQGRTPIGMNDGQWHQIAWLSKGSGNGNLFYFDGEQVSLNWQDGNDPNGVWFDDQSTDTHSIGGVDRPTPDWQWTGRLDEIRIIDAPVNADLIATEYANQNTPSDFTSFGVEEQHP